MLHIWEPFKISDFKLKTGKDSGTKTYRICQLLTSTELTAEGRDMGHCVSSYIGSCSAGRSSIWSLTIEDFVGNIKKLVTIEVDRSNVICQIKGKHNRSPETNEISIIKKWSTKEGLKLSRWVV